MTIRNTSQMVNKDYGDRWDMAFRSKKKPKLLLVSLHDPYMDSDRVMPPLGIMSLHAYMLACDVNSTIENDFDMTDLSKYENYTHIGISCMTPQKKQAYEILQAVKCCYPEIVIIIGGSHAKFYYEDCSTQPFDHIVIGDGEYALQSILDEHVVTPRTIEIPISEEDMNKLPLPYRESSFLNQYEFDVQGHRATTILTAKGCPMSCGFCEHANTKVKLYSAENVGRQIDEAKAVGYDSIMFFDDIFCLSKKRVVELGLEILKRAMPYRCFAHAKTMTNEIAYVLSDTGCIEVGFGAESGSQKILDNINKKTTVEQNEELVRVCNERGIKVKAFLMLGLPGESKETVKDTTKFLRFLMSNKFYNHKKELSSNDFDLGIYFPYKGTPIRDSIDRSENIYDLFLECNPDKLQGVYKGKNGIAEAVVRTSSLTSEEIVYLKNSLYTRFKGL